MQGWRRVHVVHAHPEPHSFIAAMRDVVVGHFEQAGARVTLSDLYAQHFNPVASKDDFQSRAREDYLVYALEQRHAYETGTLAADIRDELDRLLAADLVVFTFPVFWFGLPAILKGWVDRVLVSGVCYGGKRIYGRGGLAGKTALAVFGLGGRDYMFGPQGIHGELTMGMLRHFFQGTLGYVGLEVVEPFIAYHVPYITDDDRKRLLTDLKAALQALDRRPRLVMPDLGRFGSAFEPLEAVK